MKDEIKDLLQYLKNVYESEETSTWLNKLQIKDLLDYITNLQEQNMKYDQCLTELTDNYKDLQKELTNLQEENESLKKSITDIVQQNIDNSFEKDMYKTRNEKAIEKCINKQYETNAPWLIKFAKDVENILQGEQNE